MNVVYPFSVELQKTASNFTNGNFGLWFYKFVPLDERKDFKACTPRAGEKSLASFYQKQYYLLKAGAELRKMLEKRHEDQQRFCRLHGENGAKVIEMRAELSSPLITGIGKTHPNEVGMTFDHTMGIPYLPATGIKGVVRLGHILNLLADQDKVAFLVQNDTCLDDTHPDSLIPDIFGGDAKTGGGPAKLRGKAIFLDAYPEKIPNLHVDIMNPHYGDYYSDDSAQVPPADYLNPVPIQFLTIKPGEVIVFRAIVKDQADLFEPLLMAYHKALSELGFGAKTAVGYGRFRIHGSSGTSVTDKFKEKHADDAITAFEKGLRADAPGPAPVPSKVREKPPAPPIVWEKVTLIYKPNNQELVATNTENKKAFGKGLDLLPEGLREKMKKKKSAKGMTVEVLPVGNAFRIVTIHGQ